MAAQVKGEAEWEATLRRACRDCFDASAQLLLVRHCLKKDEEPKDSKKHVDDVRDLKGNTLLHYACEGGSLLAVETLIGKYGANIETVSKHGNVPLHHAARRGHIDCMRMLVERFGASPDPVTAGCSTPLHRAAFEARAVAIEFLLQAGANPFMKNRRDQTALDICGQSTKITQASKTPKSPTTAKNGVCEPERSLQLLRLYCGWLSRAWNPASHPYFPKEARLQIQTLVIIARARYSRRRYKYEGRVSLCRFSLELLAYVFAHICVSVMPRNPARPPAPAALTQAAEPNAAGQEAAAAEEAGDAGEAGEAGGNGALPHLVVDEGGLVLGGVGDDGAEVMILVGPGMVGAVLNDLHQQLAAVLHPLQDLDADPLPDVEDP